MLLYLFLSTVEPGSGGLDIPPATDPTGRIIAVVVALSAMFGPWLTAKVKKSGASNGPTPITNGGAPRLDVGEEWLKKYVTGLEGSVEALKAENAIQRKQILELTGDRATFVAQNEALREDIAGLRAEIQELRGQLRGRGNSGR